MSASSRATLGVSIAEDDTVTITSEASFWTLPDEDAVQLLKKMRAMAPHRRDLARIVWFKDRHDPVEAVRALADYPDVIAAMRRIASNPLATSDLSAYCADRLSRRDSLDAEQRTRDLDTQRLRAAVLSRDQDRCRYCGCHCYGDAYVDHVVPTASGGLTNMANLVSCCADCKLQKRGKSLAEAGMQLLDPRPAGR